MKSFIKWLGVGTLFFLLTSTLALAQPSVKIRGVISAFDGNTLLVKSREGTDFKVIVAETTGISSMYSIAAGEIKTGSFVGVTAIPKQNEVTLNAIEVHLFPDALRGMGEGHREWDLAPNSTMTNANVDSIVEKQEGKELTLSYKGGSQKILVPADTPVVSFKAGDKALLKEGANVYLVAKKADDGTLTAQHIQVGKDGIKPPM